MKARTLIIFDQETEQCTTIQLPKEFNLLLVPEPAIMVNPNYRLKPVVPLEEIAEITKRMSANQHVLQNHWLEVDECEPPK